MDPLRGLRLPEATELNFAKYLTALNRIRVSVEQSMAKTTTRSNFEIGGESITDEANSRKQNVENRMLQERKLARRLLASWRRFKRVNKTSYELARQLASFGLSSGAALGVVELQTLLTDSEFLASAKALLGRLQRWLLVSTDPSQRGSVTHLLKKLRARQDERYPARLFLSAYMVCRDNTGTIALDQAAQRLVLEFEALVSTVLKTDKRTPFTAQLLSFDAAWNSYLKRFLAWKTKDASLLEEDLISSACKQQASMLEGQAMEQEEEHATYIQACKQMLFGVTGPSGVLKLEQALEAGRAKFQEAEYRAKVEKEQKEQILNEIFHGAYTGEGAGPSSIQAQVKETMEKAYWDSVEEKLVQEQDFRLVGSLIGELRDLLEELVPEKWKGELHENLDVELLSQMLESDNIDHVHMLKLLHYCVELVLRLEAPGKVPDIKAAYEALLGDLSNSTTATQESIGRRLVKGLRFLLQHVQSLKQSIAMTKVAFASQMIHEHEQEAIMYMRKVFEGRYNLRMNHRMEDMLPRTSDCLSKAKARMESERDEFEAALARVPSVSSSEPSRQVPTFPIRTGGQFGSVPLKQQEQVQSSGRQMKRIDWNTTEAAVRYVLLDVVCSMEPAVEGNLPETLRLNVARIRHCQNELQRIAIMATGLLILRQELVTGKVREVESIVEGAAKSLDALLDEAEVSIVDKMASLFASICMKHLNKDVKALMAGILQKSFSAENVVFQRVVAMTRCSLRDVLIAGNSAPGKALATATLDKICGRFVLHHVVNLAALLDILATVTTKIHGPWYALQI